MKILIIRFSSIGDIILTTPVVRCIKKQLKDVELHYLTKKAFSSVIENNPYIDKKIYLEDSLEDIITLLRQERYDYIIDLHNNLRSTFVRWNIDADWGKLNKINFSKWLMVKLKINVLPATHIVNRYLKVAEPLQVKNDGEGLDYFIPREDEIRIEDLPLTHLHGFVGVVIGAKHFTKRLPLSKLLELCESIQAPIILLGGKEDEAVGAQLKEKLGHKVFNACGKLNLNQSASLVKLARVIVAHDTALMHIAAAFKKEIYSVWGNTILGFGMYPYYGDKVKYSKQYETLSHYSEVKNLSCRPCSKIGYNECPKKHFKCMVNQDVMAIANAIHAVN